MIFLLVLTLPFLLGGCAKGEPTRADLFPPNEKPVAVIEALPEVGSGATVQLDGSKSFDPEGKPITFEWTFIEKPVGSLAAFDNPASPTTTFLADTDGEYRVDLRVVEEPDPTLPAGVPLANQGLPSDPKEVTIQAGRPGPFEGSGNKLILDGTHIALSALPVEISGGKEMTAEGWFWINRLPADNSEVFLFAKKEAFEATLRADQTLAFRIYKSPTDRFELAGPVSWPLQAWHHLATLIDRQKGISYVAVDGKIVLKAPFSDPMNTNPNRFSIGGLQGEGSLDGMVDEVRITQNVRYADVDFDPPKELLIGDSPFLSGAINTVHGLWHFDERVGATLFHDFSLRGNELFRIGEGGFQPFGTMRLPRIGHQVTKLDDGSLWASGGYDSSHLPVDTTERLMVGDAGRSSVLFNTFQVKNEAITSTGVVSGNTIEFDFTLAQVPVVSGSLRVKATVGANTFTAFDLGDTNLTGTGIKEGKIDYATGGVKLTFFTTAVSDPNNPLSADYSYDRKGGAFHHTATKLAGGNVLVAGGDSIVNGVDTPTKAASLFIPSPDPESFIKVGDMAATRRYHAAAALSDGRGLIVGGEGIPSGGTSITTLASSEYFDPISGTFSSAAPSLGTPRKFHQMIGLKDCNPAGPERFLVVGGYGADQIPVAQAELYLPVTPTVGVFRPSGKMTKGRVRHAVACLPNGIILVTGGIDPTGRILDTAEVYDPVTETFTLLATRMNSPRADHTMTVLPDGRVLVVGGFNQLGLTLASAEIYDLAADLFSYTSSFPGLGRYGHFALPWKGGAANKDGVLLVGGADSEGNVLPLLEMFYP